MYKFTKKYYLCVAQCKIYNKTKYPMKAKFLFPLFALLAMMGACQGTPDNGGENNGDLLAGKITLIVDHEFIRANGSEAASFTVLLQDNSGMFHDVTADSDIYIAGNDTPIEGSKFTTESTGSWTFYALYGLEVSNEVGVSAVAGIADIPADPKPESTDFHHRILLLQHTGTACPNCPRVMSDLKKLSEDSAYNTRYNHVASHSYNSDDPAHSSAADVLSRALSVMFYPWVTFNLTEVNAVELSGIKRNIDEIHRPKADVGIALSVSNVDGKIYANVAVKAAKSGNYRMSVWVLEDGIVASQSGANASWQNTHNNALREMVGENRNERIYGKNIGTIEAGKTYETLVGVELDSEWVASCCEVMIIVTTDDGKGGYDAVNTAVCTVGESHAFEYNN